MNPNKKPERGAVAVYMALIIAVLIISSALVFNTILVRQIRLGRAVANSERAFAAANTGYEQALHHITTTPGLSVAGEGEISYGDEKATYTFKGQVFVHDNIRVPCVLASGTYRDETRRLFTGPAECDLISS